MLRRARSSINSGRNSTREAPSTDPPNHQVAVVTPSGMTGPVNSLQAELETPPDWYTYRPFPDVVRRNRTQESVEVPLVVWAFRLPKRRRMLELGCGCGIALPALNKLCRPTRLVGIDIDEALLTEAAKRLAKYGVTAELCRSDVRRMPFPDRSFDIVIDFGTCYHISYPACALQEVYRILTFGGILVHETMANQLVSHPMRAWGRTLPWTEVAGLVRNHVRVLWSSRVKT